MKLGLQLGYWGRSRPPTTPSSSRRRRSPASTRSSPRRPGGPTRSRRWPGGAGRPRGSGSAPRSCRCRRSPTSIAMHALTLDHLSDGRMILGMGVSGPQVVEGWYGQPFGKPLARTREVVDIIRKVLAREGPVTNDGPHYPLPFPARTRSASASRSSRSCTRCAPTSRSGSAPRAQERRPDRRDRRRLDPDLLHAQAAAMYRPWLDEGFARQGARRTRDDFEIAATCHVQIVADADESRPSSTA